MSWGLSSAEHKRGCLYDARFATRRQTRPRGHARGQSGHAKNRSAARCATSPLVLIGGAVLAAQREAGDTGNQPKGTGGDIKARRPVAGPHGDHLYQLSA